MDQRLIPDGYHVDADGNIIGPQNGVYTPVDTPNIAGYQVYENNGRYYTYDDGVRTQVPNPNSRPDISLSDRRQHHDTIVEDISLQLETQGYTVANEVNINSPDDSLATRTDIIFVRPDDSIGIIEVKTGNATLSQNQSTIFPSIEDGSAVVTQQLADRLNSSLPPEKQLIPGKTLAESGHPQGISIYVARAPGL